jgi:predicted nucleotidyltransferase component of viral defense system
VSSRWFAGESEIRTYMLDELLGTKMRALYQRKKSRDLFDLAVALERGAVDPARIIFLCGLFVGIPTLVRSLCIHYCMTGP